MGSQTEPRKGEDFVGMLDRRVIEERSHLGSELPPLPPKRFKEIEEECLEHFPGRPIR
jgi:hypothetical protein